MVLFLESFGPYATAQLPALDRWGLGDGAVIVAGGGRSGSTSDNCAEFDTALAAFLQRTLNASEQAGVLTITCGFALRILLVTAHQPVIVASIGTTSSQFNLVIGSDGSVEMLQVTGSVPLGTVCAAPAGTMPIDGSGRYLEARVIFTEGLATACQLRISDSNGDMHAVAEGPLLQNPGDLSTQSFRFGGFGSESPAVFRVTDAYVTDGVPAATVINYNGLEILNDGYLGNTHVEAVYAAADGEGCTSPWTPSTGSSLFNLINEAPPDDDGSYISAGTDGQASTFAFGASLPGIGFGQIGCQAVTIPIYALQWTGRIRQGGNQELTVLPIVREIVTGVISGDTVVAGPPQTITIAATDYAYYLTVWDRNPIDSTAFEFEDVDASIANAIGSLQFGLELQV